MGSAKTAKTAAESEAPRPIIDTDSLEKVVDWMFVRGVRRIAVGGVEIEVDLNHALRDLPKEQRDEVIGDD